MSRKFIALARWSVFALLLGLWLPCQAQFGSNLQGTVSDSKGAVIPNAVVKLHNTNTGVDLKTTTNATGFYRFASAAPGDYSVIVSSAGFKTVSTSVTVTVDQTRGVDVTLNPAAAGAEIVTVTAEAPELNPEETRLQTTLAANEITKLPMAGHDVQQLIALTPGATGFENTNPGSGYGATLFAPTFAPPFQANGTGNNSNLFLLDDLPISDDTQQGHALIFPNADMIDTVSLQTQTYSVENGTAASLQTSFSTKSGSNRFHGDIDYTYAGANIGAANNVTNTITPASGGQAAYGTPTDIAPVFHQNQILGSVGGPIFKGRTFFFFSMQKQNAGIGGGTATGETWDPDFVAWGHATFPNSGMATGATLAPNTRDTKGPHFTRILASSTKNPCGVASIQNTPTGPVPYNLPCDMAIYDNGLIFNQAQPFNGTQWFARVDQTFRNGGDRIYAGYERIGQYLGYLGDRPLLDGASPSTTKYASLNWIHVVTPRLLNELHGGNLRGTSGTILLNPIAGSYPAPGPAVLDVTMGYAYLTPFGTMPIAPASTLQHSYNLRDTVTYSINNHTVRGGYQFTREDYLTDDQWFARGFPYIGRGSSVGIISNNAAFSGGLWTISGLTGGYSPQIYGATSIFNGVWVDDSWKVRPNLTITAGIRYDDFGNPTRYSTSSPFAPLYPGSGSNFHEQALHTTTHISPNAFTQAQNTNIQPRVGFAYTPLKEGDLVIHGGIGLYENALTPAQIANNLPTQPPVRISLSTNGPLDWGDFTTKTAPWGHTYNGKIPFPVYGTTPSGNVYSCPAKTDTPNCIYAANLNGFAPDVTPEKYLLYSLGIEKEFRGRIVAGIAYSGSHGYDLIVGNVGAGPNGVSNADFNLMPGYSVRPTTEWGQLRYTVNAGTASNFNAMILTLKQNYKRLSYQANYNWERALQWAPTYSDSSYGQVAFWPGVYDAKVYYGPSSIDIANSFSFGGSYEVPKLHVENHLLNGALSEWRISTITVAQTGTPFSVGNATGASYANDNSIALDSSSGGTPQFPTYAAGLRRKGFSRKAVSTSGAFYASNFTNPAGVGTSAVLSQQGANTFRNPGYFNVNAGLAKSFGVPFRWGEDAKFTMRGDFINLLNRTNWGSIGNDIQKSPQFGFSTTAQNKRYVQLGARFEF